MLSLSLAFALGVTMAPATGSPQGAPAAPIDTKAIVALLVEKLGKQHEHRLARGVEQVAALWRASDGDLQAFALEHFITDDQTRRATLMRFESVFEQVDGHFLEIARELRRATDLDVGPILHVDPMLAGIDPASHMLEDLFVSKIAFVALLNFPLTTLDERIAAGPQWTREEWAESRLSTRFARRVPADVVRSATEANAKADIYISTYNIWMHHVLDAEGKRVFPSGKRLISHWNLRDELKAQYANGVEGANRQRVIVRLMERIVSQAIPVVVIDNPHVDYNPFTNSVVAAPPETVEKDAPPAMPNKPAEREPDTRYAHLLAQFEAQRAADPYSPTMPNAIQRAFELNREMPEARVRKLLDDVLTSPLVPQVAREIERRLGRELAAQDLWYDGFKSRSSINERDLDAMTKARFRKPEDLEKAMPSLLATLGFSKERARWLAEHIVVDPSRGAGHALQAARRGDFPRLRTRIEPDGMNYKGFNIAVHELGHNVEQCFSLYEVDHTLLAGVPNYAFTEAIAFLFQARDLELLGITNADAASAKREATLAAFWATWEIAGVALVDIDVWRWMYAHPNAKPGEVKDAAVQIAEDVWTKYYAPLLGGGVAGQRRTTPLLGIYSHMITYPLYLADYPLGHLIAFQIEEHLVLAQQKGSTFGAEIERMTKTGNIAPDLWMQRATGDTVSAAPLLRATEKALLRPK